MRHPSQPRPTSPPASRAVVPVVLVPVAVLLLAVAGCGGTAQGAAAVQQPPDDNVIVHRAEADRLWVFADSPDELGSGGEFHIYLDAETHPEAPAAFAEYGLGAGGALPIHRHEKTTEIAYFLEGEGVVRTAAGDEVRELPVGAGDVWFTPPGAWHGLRNTGDGPLKLVFATIPNEETGLLSFFRRIGVKPGEAAEPLPPEEFARIAAAHDLILRPATSE